MLWLVGTTLFCIGYACRAFYDIVGEIVAFTMPILMLCGIALIIFGIDRAVKWITGSGIFNF